MNVSGIYMTTLTRIKSPHPLKYRLLSSENESDTNQDLDFRIKGVLRLVTAPRDSILQLCCRRYITINKFHG